MVGLPILIYGTVTESSVGVDTITVKIRNNTTNNVGTATTNSSGLYLIDLSDDNYFPKGYAVGDQITVYTIYSNFEGEETLTLASNVYGYQQDVTLSAVTDSELIYYCSVQNVYDELDEKTATDISTTRIVNAIQRAEGLIDLKTGTAFKEVTVTDETHTVDRYSIDISPDALDTYASAYNLRRDTWFGATSNRVKTNYTPIVSITSLSLNAAGFNAADSWTEKTEQTGSGGDYLIEDADAGIIDFITTFPRIGKRSWKITYVYGYDRDSTDRHVIAILKCVERLTILLACKSIITMKSTGSTFDSTQDVRIGTIEVRAGAMTGKAYLNSIEPEIKELWQELGEMGIEVI